MEKQNNKGNDVRWNGWDMVIHTPDPKAARDPLGRYSRRTERWGFETVVPPNDEGIYLVNYKLARGKNARR